MLTESILIVLFGPSCGVLGAIGAVRALVALLLPDFPCAHGIHVDARPNPVHPSSRHQNYCDRRLLHGSLEVEF
jgi:hypothetical protein